MPELDAVRRMELTVNQILEEAKSVFAWGDIAEFQDLLEIASKILSGDSILATLSAHATSLELRTHRLRAWIEEERKNAAQEKGAAA